MDNFIEILEDEAFLNMTNLRIINLERNYLSALNFHAFSSLTNLEILDLQQNHILILQPGSFSVLAEDAIVSLTCNKIFQIGNFLPGTSLKIQINLQLDERESRALMGMFSRIAHSEC